MQEQNSEKIVSLSVRATKMTARVLKAVISEYLKHQKNKQPQHSGKGDTIMDKKDIKKVVLAYSGGPRTREISHKDFFVALCHLRTQCVAPSE